MRLLILTVLLAMPGLALAHASEQGFVLLLPTDLSKEMKTAPLTAGFGLFVIFTYAIAGIFAPIIAPYGEAEVISSAFAPADENMLLGADQLGRDMFSRIIYGARNTVGLALVATTLAFLIGATLGAVPFRPSSTWALASCLKAAGDASTKARRIVRGVYCVPCGLRQRSRPLPRRPLGSVRPRRHHADERPGRPRRRRWRRWAGRGRSRCSSVRC